MDSLSSRNSNITMASFNCKSVKRSVQHVRDLCQYVDLVCLQETWLMPHDINFVNEIDENFSCISKSSVDTSVGVLRGRPYGGLALMWRRSVFPDVTKVECNNDRLIAVKIKNLHCEMLVFSIYMPCDTDKVDDLIEFTSCLSQLNAIVSDSNIEVVFALGDFNAHPSARYGQELLEFCLAESWVCADIDLLGLDPNTYTFMCESSGSRRWLDHCLGTEAARKTILRVKVDNDVNWSDHFPLLIDINMDIIIKKVESNSGNTRNYNKIVWNNRNLEQINQYGEYCYNSLKLVNYSSHNESCFKAGDNCDILECKVNIDSMYNEMISILQNGAAISCSRTGAGTKGRQIAGWNYHVKSSHMQARLYFSWWVNLGKPDNGYIFENMLKFRKIFKNKLKWCQRNEESIKMDILATNRNKKNFPKFWKATKSFKYKDVLPVSVNNEQDPTKIANMFAKHFKIQPINVVDVQNVEAAVPDTYEQQKPLADLNNIFTPDHIAKVVRCIKRGKSPGHDGLSIEHILYASDEVYRILSIIFRLCFKHSYLPKDLMQTLVAPIVKNKTGDLSSLSNYRPISLGTIVGKILERLLQSELTRNFNIDDAQFGFRAGLSTDSAILSLKYTVDYYVNRETSVYACFLDLSRAFDLVNYNILWRKLTRHASNEMVNLWRFWYENQTNYVKWGDAFSSEYRLECGVRQGGLTSPDLFNLYVNDLIERLRGTKVGCHIGNVCVNNLSYADDMVLLSPSINGLRKLLSICEQFAKEHGLKYNAAKTEMIVFKAGKGPDTVLPVFLNGSSVRIVKSFKYLGHILTEDCKDDRDMERERRALCVRANMIARRFVRCSDEVKVTLFKAFCQCFYTCQLWTRFTKRSYNALRIQYNNAFRILMKQPRFCSAKGMFATARVPDFFAILRSRTASCWDRLRHSKNSILMMIIDDLSNPFARYWSSLHRCENVNCGNT